MNRSKNEIMHEAALRVIAKYRSTGEPFALFLSSWSFDAARTELQEIMTDDPRPVQVRIGLERQVRIVLKGHGLETVAVYRKGDDKRIAIPEEWPALTLTNDGWKDRVRELAEWADLIVLFLGVDTEGLLEEVKISLSPSNRLKTVAVVSGIPRDIYLSQFDNIFPRVASLITIDNPLQSRKENMGLHKEFVPLIRRMKRLKQRALKKMNPKVRSDFIDQNKRLRKFPLPKPSDRFARLRRKWKGSWMEPLGTIFDPR